MLHVIHKYKYPILFLFLAAIPFHRFTASGLVLWDDLALPPFVRNQFTKSIWVWHSGTNDVSNLNQVPLYGFMTMLEAIPIPLPILQQSYFLLAFWLVGLSMFFLSKTLFPTVWRPGHFFAGVFYMFNPILASYFLVGGVRSYMIPYAVIPLMLAFHIRALRGSRRKDWMLTGVLLAVVSFGANVWGLEVTLSILLFYTLASSLLRRSFTALVRGFSVLGKTVTFFLALASFWVIPGMVYLQSIYSTSSRIGIIGAQAASTLRIVNASSQAPIDAFRLYSTSDDYGFNFYYGSLESQVIGFAIVLLAVTALLWSRNRPATLTVSILLLVFWGLSSMTDMGLLPHYVGLIDSLPVGKALVPLDTTWFLFYGVSPFLAVLLGDSLGLMMSAKPKTRIIVVPIVFALLLANAWPIATGYDTSARVNNLTLNFNQPVQLPSYYTDLQQYMAQQGGDFNVFLLPSPTTLFYSKYSWLPNVTGWANVNSNQGIQELTGTLLLDNPSIDTYYVQPFFSRPQPLMQTIEHAIYQNLTQYTGRLLQLVGAKFLILRADLQDPIQWTTNKTLNVNVSETVNILAHQKDLVLVAQFGKIFVYENTEQVSDFYPARSLVAVMGNTDILIRMSNAFSFDGRAFAFRNDYSDSDWKQVLAQSSDLVVPSVSVMNSSDMAVFRGRVVTYAQIGLLGSLSEPFEYKLKFLSPVSALAVVNGTQSETTPAIYVLNQAEDTDWSLTCNGSPGTHFKVNAFSNGYLSDCPYGSTISIRFDPFSVFQLSAYISAALTISILLVALITKTRSEPESLHEMTA